MVGRDSDLARHWKSLGAHMTASGDAGTSKTYLTAQRLAGLVLGFSNSRTPLSSTMLHEAYYPDTRSKSFQRAFERDRQRLETMGFVVCEVGRDANGVSLWQVDRSQSLVEGVALSERDALVVDVVCRSLASDEEFPYATELGSALRKIDRYFAEDAVAYPAVRVHNETARTLVSCLSRRQTVRAVYTDAGGMTTTRDLELLGSFTLRDHAYFVAHTRQRPNHRPRTYRLDRFTQVQGIGSPAAYDIPMDFDARDWCLLPFQLGATCAEATFRLPEAPDPSLAARLSSKGTFLSDGRWQTNVADIQCAARWAIATGLVPTAPQGLVTAYDHVLEEASRVRP